MCVCVTDPPDSPQNIQGISCCPLERKGEDGGLPEKKGETTKEEEEEEGEVAQFNSILHTRTPLAFSQKKKRRPKRNKVLLAGKIPSFSFWEWRRPEREKKNVQQNSDKRNGRLVSI